MRMKEVHWAKEEEHEQQQRVSGVQKHKSMHKAAYSAFTTYLRSHIKALHLRCEDRAETASITLSWLFQSVFCCPRYII